MTSFTAFKRGGVGRGMLLAFRAIPLTGFASRVYTLHCNYQDYNLINRWYLSSALLRLKRLINWIDIIPEKQSHRTSSPQYLTANVTSKFQFFIPSTTLPSRVAEAVKRSTELTPNQSRHPRKAAHLHDSKRTRPDLC